MSSTKRLNCTSRHLCTILLGILPTAIWAVGFDGIPGDYCSVRPADTKCCNSRDDQCTAPILQNHLCYCDLFCSRHPGHDCCPDYEAVCGGGQPPAITTQAPESEVTEAEDYTQECVDNAGRRHSAGEKYKYNCNECVCGSRCTDIPCVVNTQILDRVNNNDGQVSWRAQNYSQFWGMPLLNAVNYRLGTLYPENTVKDMNEISMEEKPGKLPQNFDAREKWPEYIHEVRDQQNCGASWAFSTTTVAADRLAIQSNGVISVTLSPQQLLSCNHARQRGCKGGYLDRAWWYIHRLGVVNEQCYPYTSGQTNDVGQCQMPGKFLARTSSTGCPSGEDSNVAYKTTPVYRVSSKLDDIKTEIMLNGPVQATFVVHEDFYVYKSGVYRHQDLGRDFKPHHRKTGYHSVRIIGWGVDRSSSNSSPTEYWICDNSWGTWWGEDGFFKIVAGENHCEIESFVLAAWGKFGKKKKRHSANNKKIRRLFKI